MRREAMTGLAAAAAAALVAACVALPSGPMPVEPDGGPGGSDRCGAGAHQWLVGRGHGEIPAAPAGRRWRVYATGQPVTMDFSEQRMNIEYDPRTHRIVRVYCG